MISYSMIVSGASANFGIIIGGLSLLFILLGAVFTMALTTKQKHFPGLPIATALGLIPVLLILFF